MAPPGPSRFPGANSSDAVCKPRRPEGPRNIWPCIGVGIPGTGTGENIQAPGAFQAPVPRPAPGARIPGPGPPRQFYAHAFVVETDHPIGIPYEHPFTYTPDTSASQVIILEPQETFYTMGNFLDKTHIARIFPETEMESIGYSYVANTSGYAKSPQTCPMGFILDVTRGLALRKALHSPHS